MRNRVPRKTPELLPFFQSEERLRALQLSDRDRLSDSKNVDQRASRASSTLCVAWKSDDMYRKGEIRLTDIARLLGSDWPALAAELELSEDEVTKLMDEYGENAALHMLRYWLKSRGADATGNINDMRCTHTDGLLFDSIGNCLQQALRKISKENIVHNCVFNIEWVTDAAEKEVAKSRLTSRGGSVDGTGIGGRRVRSLPCFFSRRHPLTSL